MPSLSHCINTPDTPKGTKDCGPFTIATATAERTCAFLGARTEEEGTAGIQHKP